MTSTCIFRSFRNTCTNWKTQSQIRPHHLPFPPVCTLQVQVNLLRWVSLSDNLMHSFLPPLLAPAADRQSLFEESFHHSYSQTSSTYYCPVGWPPVLHPIALLLVWELKTNSITPVLPTCLEASDIKSLNIVKVADLDTVGIDLANINKLTATMANGVPAPLRASPSPHLPNGKAASPYVERSNPMGQGATQTVSSKDPKAAALAASDMRNVVRRKLTGYVGFANLPNQWHRKSVRKGFNFNVMVVG
jgi:hypothetical protein